MPKVLIAPMTLAGIDGEFLRVLCAAGFTFVFPPAARQLTEDELMVQLNGVVASLAGSEPYNARVFQAHPQLKVVARVGVGYDAVDLAAATAAGVAVTITPNTNQEAVAELCFTLMLCLAKDLVAQHTATKGGGWPRRALLPLRGRVLGIAGLGRIGKAVATRGQAFGMKVIAHDPVPDEKFGRERAIPFLSFEDLLRQADYVTLHLPATAETRHMINARTLGLMKPTAFLINTARGTLVNEADLFAALGDKRIAGAGLDVYENEPPGKLPLFDLPNVVLMPHAAGTDLQSRDDMALSGASAIVALSRGEWPAEKIVNPAVRERFRWGG